MATLQIDRVRKSFVDGKQVLGGVSFAAEDGQFVSLLGASGCGKTTLLRIIAGLEFADDGAVRIDGQDVSRLSPKDRDIAMVFQNYALYPHLTVRENVAMGLKLRKFPAKQIEERVAEAARMLGLSELLDRKPSALSGGQRQRVALARCLVRQPKLFLLDEPLSNLDAVLRERTRGELKLLFKRVHGTVVYVTHDQVEAMTMSDLIVVMDKGEIQQAGTPEQIYRAPANTFVATFLGNPPMNLLDPAKAAQAKLIASSEGDRIVGVRPEDVRLSAREESGLLPAQVALAEPTGPVTILTLDFGPISLRATAPGHWPAGQAKAWAALPPSSLHWFDKATGKRV
jgi:ABC-type sugar transport system ATPase subunit